MHFHPQRGGDRALGIPQRSRRTNAAGAPEARSDLRRMGRAKRNPSSRLCPGVAVMGFASLYPSYGEKVAKSSAPVSISLALLRRPALRPSRDRKRVVKGMMVSVRVDMG